MGEMGERESHFSHFSRVREKGTEMTEQADAERSLASSPGAGGTVTDARIASRT
jgi:hypothetical protein